MVAEAVTTTVEENSASETHSQSELSTDATPILESEPHPATAPARVDRAVSAMSDEKVQSTTVSISHFLFGEWSDQVITRATQVSPKWSQKFEILDRFVQAHETRQISSVHPYLLLSEHVET